MPKNRKIFIHHQRGFSFINQHLKAKKYLQSLAQYLKIPNNKKYTMQELQEKIIEATIGYRLSQKQFN